MNQPGRGVERNSGTANPDQRRHLVLTGLLASLLVVAGCGAVEFFLVQPASADNQRLASELASLSEENRRTEAMVANYEQFRDEAARVEAEYAETLSAIPSEAELAAALNDLEDVTRASGVKLIGFTPSKVPPKPAATSGASTAAPPSPVDSRQIAVAVHSRYDALHALLDRLATYPRLLTVESFSVRSANAEGYTAEATLTLNCYFKVAPQPAAANVPTR